MVADYARLIVCKTLQKKVYEPFACKVHKKMWDRILQRQFDGDIWDVVTDEYQNALLN